MNFKSPKAIVGALSASLVLSVIAAAAVPTAAHAAANPLAQDSTLRMYSCDQSNALDDLGLLEMDISTLTGFRVGSSGCGTGWYYNSEAFNPNNGQIYVSASKTIAGKSHYGLFKLDINTGARTSGTSNSSTGAVFAIDNVTVADDGFPTNPGIAIDPITGVAYAYVYDDNSSTRVYTISQLDEDTVNLTLAFTVNFEIQKLAYNPDGKLYAFDRSHMKLVVLNTSSGAVSDVASNWHTDYPELQSFDRSQAGQIGGMAFDSAGTLFMQLKRNQQNVGTGTIESKEIWYAKPTDNYNVLTLIPGTHTHLQPTVLPNQPWGTITANSAGTGVDPSGRKVDINGGLVITYGRNLISYKAQGGTIDRLSNRFTSKSQREAARPRVISNSPITLPNATRTGYIFNGWFTAATGGTLFGAAGDTYNIPDAQEDSFNMYAQWTSLVPPTSDHELGSVTFAGSGSVLSSAAKAKIKAWVKANAANTSSTYRVVGYVQKTKSTKNDQKLSLARATAVKKYLQKLGVKAEIATEVGTAPAGIAKTPKARKATLIANY